MKSWYFLLVSALALTLCAAEIPRYLVTDGSEAVLAKRAESELQLFWKRIFGQELEKVAAGQRPAGAAVYLGNTELARKAAGDKPQFGEEEWLVQTVGNDLVLTGGKPAGTLYAVYALLENLGVAFLAPDETTVPPAPAALPTFQERKKPDFIGRLIFDAIPSFFYRTRADQSVRDEYALWLLRNRINGEQFRREVKNLYTNRFYKITTTPNYHSFSCYVPPSLFDEHPEYFGMDEFGVRRKPNGFAKEGTLCMTNPDVLRLTVEALRKYIIRDREGVPEEEWPYIYDISQLDNSPNFCRCPECAKITAEEGSQTGLLMHYINHVAREIRKEYPGIVIRTFGYSASRTPPRKIMPESNVLIQLTDKFSVSDPFHPLSWTKERGIFDNIEGWGKSGAPMMLWDYWNLGGTYYNPPRIETIINSLQEDFRYFLTRNIKALFLEAEVDHVSPQNFMLLSYYVANHLMVEVEQDIPRLERQFIDGYYGPAAPTVWKWYNLIKEGVLNDPQRPSSAVVPPWKFATPAFVVGMVREFQAEMAKLPAGSKYIRRLQNELVSPLFVVLTGWGGYRKAFESAGYTFDSLKESCRRYSYDFTHYYPYTGKNEKFKQINEEYGVKAFEEKLGRLLDTPKVPEQFANVPPEDLRAINYRNFRGVAQLGAAVKDDPEALEGKALCSADSRAEMHGVNALLPNQDYGFRTTEFTLGNHKMPGKVKLYLKKVPQDEKYHWFRIPGSVELKPVSYFWGHGWAIQAKTAHWFVLTDGNPLDNTWDQVWFRGKFTGPAYVPGSAKENAIWVDTVVATRNQPETQFQPIAMNTDFTETGAERGWEPNPFFKNTGTCQVIDEQGKRSLRITAVATAPTEVQGPISVCAPDDWLMVKVKASGAPCEVGFYFFDGKEFLGRAFRKVPDNGIENTLVFDVSEVKNAAGIERCRLVIRCSAEAGVTTIERLAALAAHKLNQFD
ncbi:MAG: DUF4838 domain-containing protein [Victivallales bacterium]|nr:DUF4838 domain-containing protein [Victivallales bacterium]